MPYVGQKPADIIATAVDTTTGKFSGVVDADAGITVDNITIDGTEIDLSSGDLTLDVAGDIILDADGGDITIKDGGTSIGAITNTSSDLSIYSTTSGHSGIRFHENGILPTNNAGALIDNDAVLGDASYRYTNLFLSGGVYLGGTGTANKLDDYEEGTWTPSFNNAGTQAGVYTKIGNTVFCTATITTTAAGASGAVIGSLPFTSVNSNASRGGGVVTYQDETNSLTYALLVEANATSIIMRVGAGTRELSASKAAFVSFSYKAA
jgi:hypothetical protein